MAQVEQLDMQKRISKLFPKKKHFQIVHIETEEDSNLGVLQEAGGRRPKADIKNSS
jgi:hypothetical protein